MYKTLTQRHKRGLGAEGPGRAGRPQHGATGQHRSAAGNRPGGARPLPAVPDTAAGFPGGGGRTRHPGPQPRSPVTAAAPQGRAQQPLRLRAAAASPREPSPALPSARVPGPRRRRRPRSPELHLQRHGRRHLGGGGREGKARAGRAGSAAPASGRAALPGNGGKEGRPRARWPPPPPCRARPGSPRFDRAPPGPAEAAAAVVRAERVGLAEAEPSAGLPRCRGPPGGRTLSSGLLEGRPVPPEVCARL